MKIAHFADLHFGREDKEALGVAGDLVRELDVNAIVVSGDLTQRGKREEFEAAQEWLSGFRAPILCVPGNHDTPLLNLPARASDAFGRYDRYFSGRAGPLEIDGVSIRGLNTSRGWQTRMNWAEGRVNLEDLDAMIANSDAEGLHMIVCHHPFISPAKAGLQTATKRGEEASRRLAASPVQILLTGHVHTPHAELIREGEGGYIAITAGTLSTRLRTQPPAFNILEVRDDILTLNVQTFQDGHFHEGTHGSWDIKTLEPISTPRVVAI
ncbi:Ser/Thr protein phosphatase family protein [Hyphomonas polymorpha PS728]|uniref:Ser/Thr protein phosphatase family protein n=1 Tax=Hyphomonas polymorpha PS728 TaxID=1280954 RepID=A0A062VL46_9PROT|nr:metallophosphoesterase [Hyphomonas polymorpha]KCZ98829.1 Ser/Thr protein phosphatase family protein [Hyphomonas polymorpha PS728]